MTDPSRWEQLQALFHAALDLPPAGRAALLAAADPTLAAEAERMLAADAAPSPLDHDLAPIADRLLGQTLTVGEFGPYRIVRLLGEGGMGVVYLAEREDLGRFAAVKFLSDAGLSPARRARFAAEQRLLARLDHPGIARLYDANVLPDGTPYFVMEYVEGQPITTHCQEHPLPVEARLRLLRAVAEAVRFAHSRAVIHRDLKPSNILVTPEGEVKLLDFGIAKQLDPLAAADDRTQTALRMLTPAYAAPEQIRGEPADVQSDIYPLGLILREILPETAGGDLAVLAATAAHPDPAHRYASAEALIRDIDHYLRREPLEARPDSWTYRARKFFARHRRAVLATAAAVTVLAAVTGYFTLRLARARRAELAGAARAERVQRFLFQLFAGGDEVAGPTDGLRVVTLVERGVQQARALDSDPEVQAELYDTLGGIYRKLGRLDEAGPLLEQALALRRRVFGPEHPTVAESLTALGLLREDQARYDDGERLTREAYAMTERVLPAGHPGRARALSAVGQALEDRGRYPEAIPLLEKAAALQEGGVPADLAVTLTELANCLFYTGQYDRADQINQRVVALDRGLYGPRHPHVADDLINLGAAQFERGRYAEAERYDRQALAILRDWHGNGHPETASALTLLARALNAQRRSAEAEPLLTEALAIQERTYGPVHPRVASALNDLGVAANAAKRYPEAKAHFERMANIYKKVYQDKHYLIGIALANLAGVYTETGEYRRAEELFREVLRRYADTLPEGHPNVGIALVRLGHALRLDGRTAQGREQSLAGLAILRRQPTPPARWLEYAEQDLKPDHP